MDNNECLFDRNLFSYFLFWRNIRIEDSNYVQLFLAYMDVCGYGGVSLNCFHLTSNYTPCNSCHPCHPQINFFSMILLAIHLKTP